MYLLDVNALLALNYKAHIHHGRVSRWFVQIALAERNSLRLSTCAITELGFVRIASGPPSLSIDVTTGCVDLARLKRSKPFVFLDDPLDAGRLPRWVRRPRQTNDGHLLELAAFHGGVLATMDTGIPDALFIPRDADEFGSVSEPRAPRYRSAA